MDITREAILWAADNRWLREHLPRYRFVRRSVARFMPGERLEDALAAAAALATDGVPTTFTALGENVTTHAEAQRVADHYLEAFAGIAARGLDTEISVKPHTWAWTSTVVSRRGTWRGWPSGRGRPAPGSGSTWSPAATWSRRSSSIAASGPCTRTRGSVSRRTCAARRRTSSRCSRPTRRSGS